NTMYKMFGIHAPFDRVVFYRRSTVNYDRNTRGADSATSRQLEFVSPVEDGARGAAIAHRRSGRQAAARRKFVENLARNWVLALTRNVRGGVARPDSSGAVSGAAASE